MSQTNETLINEIKKLLMDKLDSYKDILVENTDLYFKLVKLIDGKIKNNQLEINMGLVSKLDDIIEDIATMNFNMKILKQLIINNSTIAVSDRESNREERTNLLRNSNNLPLLFLMYNFIENNETNTNN